MRIYFSGLGGVGIGPAALIAKDMGHEVIGSDVQASSGTKAMEAAGIEVNIGQDGSDIAVAHSEKPIDWFIYTPALPKDHPELQFVKDQKIKASKREDFVNYLLKESNLKLIAFSGTHGKTTSTAMMAWLFKQFNVPISYSIGTTIPWGPNGRYHPNSEYFIYEADEYDKHFLKLKPYSSIISSIDYDHPDTYPTEAEYLDAFVEFIANCHCCFMWSKDADRIGLGANIPNCVHSFSSGENLKKIALAGLHTKENAFLVAQAFKELNPSIEFKKIYQAINAFPGAGRRFEKLADNIYSDYAHHPAEIRATIEMAKEIGRRVVVVYQPHQNVRQHELLVSDGYGDCFDDANSVYWIETYLTREDPKLEVVPPERLVETVNAKDRVEIVKDMNELARAVESIAEKSIVVIMGAGDIDDWARTSFQNHSK
ncbi:MAG: Mur ligase domain-containing protein [Candidatus Saccharimonadales bacterium]|nr:Mur ligase domain-containing protein [Candidatus Saccharimonadales bacterium]